jgi:Ribbon-helix-helix domain
MISALSGNGVFSMGDESVRWTIVVDKATDINLRTHLAERGLRKGALSKYVEDAVNRQLMREIMDEAALGFADLSEQEGQDLVDEALAEVRQDIVNERLAAVARA